MKRFPFGVVLVASVFGLGCGRTEVLRYSTFADAGLDAGTAPVDAGRPPVDAGIACVPGVVSPRRAVPTVMFVLDRSGSMAFDFAGHSGDPGDPLTGPRRWAVLEESLTRTLPAYDTALSMGVVLFPDDDGDQDECDVATTAALSPMVGNATSVLSLFARQPSGGTPTYSAVFAAADAVATVPGAVLVLVTDGEPNCNVALDPVSCVCTNPTNDVPPLCFADSCLDDTRSVALLRELVTSQRLVTYVIGVGDTGLNGDLSRTLDALAIAGGVPRINATHAYYSATSQAELSAALGEISARIARCTFDTGTRLVPGDSVEVRVGSSTVPFGPQGWEWVDEAAGRFGLTGTYCERAIAGEPVTLHLACH